MLKSEIKFISPLLYRRHCGAISILCRAFISLKCRKNRKPHYLTTGRFSSSILFQPKLLHYFSYQLSDIFEVVI